MKVRSLLLFCFLNLFLSAGLYAQNLFSERLDICSNEKFCMDCGTPKATCDNFTLNNICDRINKRFNFQNGYGSITLQVFVDSTGFSCVLSHNEVTHSQLTTELIISLNTCSWKPARVDGKKVNASVNVKFTIGGGKISAQMDRLDLSEMAPAGNATVYNTGYKYTNQTLGNYDVTVFTKYNSQLPDNIAQAMVMDHTDILWYATASGLTRFDGKAFNPVNETNSPFTATSSVHSITVDKDNNKWMLANKSVYMYNTPGWRFFDSAHIGISDAYRIIVNPSGEIFLPNKKGLLIVKGDRIRMIDKRLVYQMPSNDVKYAYFDSHERLWIGTSKGTIMLDKKQNATAFNNTNSPLKNTCITNIDEDDKGDLYFSMTACNKPPGDNDEEGIAIMSANGTWAHYNDKNSGMPVNQVNAILYDKLEHILWVATPLAGLVRFDLKNGWENYNNGNSPVPGFEIVGLAQDSKGAVYVGTVNGMVRLMRK